MSVSRDAAHDNLCALNRNRSLVPHACSGAQCRARQDQTRPVALRQARTNSHASYEATQSETHDGMPGAATLSLGVRLPCRLPIPVEPLVSAHIPRYQSIVSVARNATRRLLCQRHVLCAAAPCPSVPRLSGQRRRRSGAVQFDTNTLPARLDDGHTRFLTSPAAVVDRVSEL